jgi:hypothetical protein
MALERDGLKVRSRALTNTLFARLLLCDLFVHGIGGGLYDELTDELLRRFYTTEAPGYLVLSATLLLPLSTYPSSVADWYRLGRQMRDLEYNPQRHTPPDAWQAPHWRQFLVQRQEWVDRQPVSRSERRERFQQIRALNTALGVLTTAQKEHTWEQLQRCQRELQANAILGRRDYAFCLYPESLLRPFCTRFLEVS